MKLSELLKNIDIIEKNVSDDMEISGISYDSRKTEAGHLFVAITGFEADGHKFIPMAFENGAKLVVCEKRPELSVPYVLVENSRLALALISKSYFGDPALRMTVIGVTGTNGKTTTTSLIKHMLSSELGAKVGLIGTNGNMIGDELIHTEHTTPESYELQELFYRMAEAGCTHVVMEVSSHSLALSRVAGIQFDVAVYTNLTQDHLDFHGTMESYAQAKAILFRMCRAGCINIDDKWSGEISASASCGIFTYSAENNADLFAEKISLKPHGVSFEAVTKNDRAEVSLGIPGKFSVYNALSVISAGLALGLSLGQCAHALSDAAQVKGRMELVPTDGDYTILIDYSHTPDALLNALRALRTEDGHRIVVLFGCGGDRDRKKRPLMGSIAADNADYVIVTSDNPRTEEPQAIIDEILTGLEGKTTPYVVICDRVEAIHRAIDDHRPGDIILLAGKGHEDYQVIGHTKHHLDEREVVADYIEKRKNR